MTDQLLTVDQAADLIQASAKTVRRAIDRGELVASHIGEPDTRVKNWRIRRSDLDVWLERRSTRRHDSGRAEQIAPVIDLARRSGRPTRRRHGGRVVVEPYMGRGR